MLFLDRYLPCFFFLSLLFANPIGFLAWLLCFLLEEDEDVLSLWLSTVTSISSSVAEFWRNVDVCCILLSCECIPDPNVANCWSTWTRDCDIKVLHVRALVWIWWWGEMTKADARMWAWALLHKSIAAVNVRQEHWNCLDVLIDTVAVAVRRLLVLAFMFCARSWRDQWWTCSLYSS